VTGVIRPFYLARRKTPLVRGSALNRIALMIANRGERNALRKLSQYRGQFGEFAPISIWKGIGLQSLRLMELKGLVVEGPHGVYGPTFKLTTLGLCEAEKLNRGCKPGPIYRMRERIWRGNADWQGTAHSANSSTTAAQKFCRRVQP